MRKIKPIFLVEFNSAVLSGGNRRIFEFLKLGKSEGIDYIIVTSLESWKNAVKMFPNYAKILSNYKVYIKNFKEKQASIPGLKQALFYENALRSALSVSKVAVEEAAELIVGGEETQSLLTSYIAGKYSSKPWTVVFQPTTDLLQPSSSFAPLNVFNILKFVSEKPSAKNLPLLSKIGIALQLLVQLKVAEKSLMLSVSSSVVEDLRFLNPKIRFHVIEPGNGIESERFAKKSDANKEFDGIFFARLVPEKGLYDLPVIWKNVTKKVPGAMLAVAGITEEQRYVNHFLGMVSKFHLDRNIIFLGEQEENALIDLIKSSKLTLYPSLVDSFSLVTLESLACGTPVVAYDIPAITHNFGKCDAVLRCKVKDNNKMAEKTLSILRNENLRATLSKKAKEYSANYDWKDVVSAEKKAYFVVVEHLM
ncbi:MAG: glycosyltransferase [Candidatus Bathyarchaeota archaeon]|nr:glycosyltransferase [Candidatus Bathyarchaeota archaeon]MDH5788714.1 glycosyltransferase [Candidatus Bathyarchaeota archaeon]